MKLDAAFAQPLLGARGDYDRLLAAIGDARVVLIGEASHGTHEFYAERERITRRLIEEKRFAAVAIEGDWPDAYRVTRFLEGRGDDQDAEAALGGFRRFPQWMWRNDVVRDFVAWLREHNARAPSPVGFYGLDLYSLYGSIEAVLGFLAKSDPEGARRARERYACFDHFGDEPQAYAHAAHSGTADSCERQALRQLQELRAASGRYGACDHDGGEELFSAEQNARLVKNAEEYYRTMFSGRVSSWNLRDRHMQETLVALVARLERCAGEARVVVWAHNSHLGDARATEMGSMGELNLGQLARERWGEACYSIGFSTYSGMVTAADDWDEPARTKRVRPGLPGSYEALLHETGSPRFLVDLRSPALPAELEHERLQRAIGVIYRPETERQSHYFHAQVASQFDALIHIDETHALTPLERQGAFAAEPPETFPTGI